MLDKATGFTKAQRQWFLSADNNQCQFHYIGSDGRWHRCKNTTRLQVHHIVPRGWASMHYPKDFPLNGPNQGITLCEFCHVGNPDSVHPDTLDAQEAYRNGDKDAFKKMMDKRYELNRQGIPYWNTKYDLMFVRIVQKRNVAYLRNHPYPDKGKYGKIGRTKDVVLVGSDSR